MGRGAPRVLESPCGAAEHERRAVVGGVRHERERLRRERDSLTQRELSRWTSHTNERVALSAAWRRGGRLWRAEHRRGVLRGRQREVEQLAVAESAEQVLVRRLVSARKCLGSV